MKSRSPGASRRLRCIAVCSGKGGVGKTMLAVGLGRRLAARGRRVLLFDADLGLANVDLQMGIEPRFTLQDVLFGNRSLSDAVVRSNGGPDVLAAASGAPEMVEMSDARRRLLVEELMRFAGQYDYLIIDAADGIGRDVTTFIRAAPEVLVVVTNEPASIMDAYSLIKMLHRSERPPRVMLAINMVRTLAEGKALAARLNRNLERYLGLRLPVAGIIVQDRIVGDAVRARIPITEFSPRSKPARALDGIARFVIRSAADRAAPRKSNRRLFRNLIARGLPS